MNAAQKRTTSRGGRKRPPELREERSTNTSRRTGRGLWVNSDPGGPWGRGRGRRGARFRRCPWGFLSSGLVRCTEPRSHREGVGSGLGPGGGEGGAGPRGVTVASRRKPPPSLLLLIILKIFVPPAPRSHLLCKYPPALRNHPAPGAGRAEEPA